MSNKVTEFYILVEAEELDKSDKPFHGYNKKKHSPTGGLNSDFREKYNRENGSNLQAPVTESKPTGKKAARKRSFCARMSGVKGPTSKEGKLTPKGAALKRWKCKSEDETETDLGDFGKSDLYAQIDIMKGEGEGTRGGVIIGHTTSGKPIYNSHGNKGHKEFSQEDHQDAYDTHNHKKREATDKYHSQHNGDGTYSEKHAKNKKKLMKEIEHHHTHMARHRESANPTPKQATQKDWDREDRKAEKNRNK